MYSHYLLDLYKNIALILSHINQKNLCLYDDDSNLKILNKSIDILKRIAWSELSKLDNQLNTHCLGINYNKTCLLSFKTNTNKNFIKPKLLLNVKLVKHKTSRLQTFLA